MESKKFPTKPDAEGFYYENEVEETYGIATKEYENGNLVKRVPLSGKRTAIVRELNYEDGTNAIKMCNGSEDLYMHAKMSIATKVDGDKIIMMEDIPKMKLKDTERLTMAFQALNF